MRSNPPTTAHQLKKRVGTLFVAYTLSFVVVGLSYIGYSKLLSPEQFGLYSIALTISTFATLVLDGGLRSIIIKSSHDLSGEEQRTLVFLVSAFALFIVVVMVLLKSAVVYLAPSASVDYTFLATFAAAYLLSYPFIFVPTAALERRLEYGKIAWIESVGVVFEKGLPVLFFWWTDLGMYAFVLGSVLGRLFRVISLGLFVAPKVHLPSFEQIRSIAAFIKEGWWYQAGTATALLRDNLHVLLVGAWFGKEWVGYYAWGLQLCMVASQVFVQISARISLPLFSNTKEFGDRWKYCVQQIRLLTIVTVPILAAVLVVIPIFNDVFFDSKWVVAIELLPYLFLRMIPALATTPVGMLLLVERGGRSYAVSSTKWTAIEWVSASIFCFAIGPSGLAVSYGLVAWIGLYLFLRNFNYNTSVLIGELCSSVFISPSFFVSIIGAVVAVTYIHGIGEGLSNNWIVLSFLAVGIMVTAYLSEPNVRKRLML